MPFIPRYTYGTVGSCNTTQSTVILAAANTRFWSWLI